MSTKKSGNKSSPKTMEKEKSVDDDRTRQEEIVDFLKRYERNFVEVPVKDLRHIISLFLMEVYSSIYGQYSRKVRGLWAKQPDDWPVDVPFVDPNNKMKGESGKNCKPKKDACVQMLKHLYAKYQAKRGDKFPLLFHCKPDPLMSSGTLQPWRSESVLSPCDTGDDSIQLKSYSSFFSESSTGGNELDAAVYSIDGSMNAQNVIDDALEHKWETMDISESQNSMYTVLNDNSSVVNIPVLECNTMESDGTVYVIDGMQCIDGMQYINKIEADYDNSFVDLSRYENFNPLVDNEALRNIQGIVFNNNNCIATNQGGIRGPQQVVENDLAQEQLLSPEIRKIEDGGSSVHLSSEANAVGVKVDNEKGDAWRFTEEVNEDKQVHQVEDSDIFLQWDPLADSTKRISKKFEHIQRQGLLQKPLYEMLKNACFLFRSEQGELGHCTEFAVKQRLVNRAHSLEEIIDILLQLKSLPAEWEDKLKSFVTTEKEARQTKAVDSDCSIKEISEVIFEDVKHPECGAVNDPSVYNIKCRKVGDANKPLLPISVVDLRPVPITTQDVCLVKSGLDSKDQKIFSFSTDMNKEFMLSEEDSCMLPDDMMKDELFDMDSYFDEIIKAAGKDKNCVREETKRSEQKVDHYAGQESTKLISAPVQQSTSDAISYPTDDLQYYLCKSPLIVQESSVYSLDSSAAQNQGCVFSNQCELSCDATSKFQSEQCTEQWGTSISTGSPGTDIVQSFSEVSLRSISVPSVKMWQSDCYRPVMNDSSQIIHISKGSLSAQRPVGNVGDQSIMRGILNDDSAGATSTTTKRKWPDVDKVVKPQVVPKQKTPVVEAPIPTFVTNANMDDPHFSSHCRKKAKTISK